MNTVIAIFMLVNGQPVGDTMRIIAMDRTCRGELAVVDGINRNNATTGVQFIASCENHGNISTVKLVRQ